MDVQDIVTYTLVATNIGQLLILSKTWRSTALKEKANAEKDKHSAGIEELNLAKLSSEIYLKLAEDIDKPMEAMRKRLNFVEKELEEYKIKCSRCNQNQPHHHDETTQTIILPSPAIIDVTEL